MQQRDGSLTIIRQLMWQRGNQRIRWCYTLCRIINYLYRNEEHYSSQHTGEGVIIDYPNNASGQGFDTLYAILLHGCKIECEMNNKCMYLLFNSIIIMLMIHHNKLVAKSNFILCTYASRTCLHPSCVHHFACRALLFRGWYASFVLDCIQRPR